MSTIKERNSNLELLRIIAMLLIVAHHFVLIGLGVDVPYSHNKYIASVLYAGGPFGDVIFFLISGYFMCTSKFTGRKLVRIWGQTFFYSITFFGIFFFLTRWGGTPEGLKYWITMHVGTDRTDFFHALFVIGSGNYWFVTDYIILMMISPLLNLLLQEMKKEQLITTLAIATLFWSVIPTLSRSTSSFYDSQNLVWCFVIYLYAGYIRLYADMGGNGRKNLLIAIASYGIVAFSGSAAIFLSGTEIAINDAGYLARFRSPLILIAGAELLLFALKAKPFTSRLINRMSSAVFGVYLIHENQTFRYFLWKYMLGLPDSIYYSRYFLVYACTIILGIYCVSTVIDLIRQQTIERLFMKLVDDMQPKASAVYEKTKQMLVRFVEGRNIQK